MQQPFYASNEPKSVLTRDLGDCRDNHEKIAERVSYGCDSHMVVRKEKQKFWFTKRLFDTIIG